MKILQMVLLFSAYFIWISDGFALSAEKRANKKAAIVGEIGLGIAPLPTSGITAGYYVTKDIVAELNYINGSAKFLGSSLSWSMATIRSKWFVGNSFYVNTGAAMRNFEFENSYDIFGLAGGKQSVQTKTSSIGLDVGVGNQWQWDTFTIGCDWVGYFQPLSTSKDEANAGGLSAGDLSDFKSSTNLGESGHLSLLKFYIGAAF